MLLGMGIGDMGEVGGVGQVLTTTHHDQIC